MQLSFATPVLTLACLLAPLASVHGEGCVPIGINGPDQFTLLAGQTIDAGTVSLSLVSPTDDSKSNLYVTYKTTGKWELEKAHLWVGSDIEKIPQNHKGNPTPGKFPYKTRDLDRATVSHTFIVPLKDLRLSSCPGTSAVLNIAAHAALLIRKDEGDIIVQTATGYSDGKKIVLEKGNWATYSPFTIHCSCSE
jgi:hypothetical protein